MKFKVFAFIYTLLFLSLTAGEKPLKYLALGDSYTIGVSVEEQFRYPVLFAKHLNSLGLNIEKPKIIAENGWTTTNLLDAVNKEKLVEKFDLVTLCIGVNNQYQGRDIEEFRLEFKKLLKLSIEFAGNEKKNVIVLSIPNWGKTPFASDRDIVKIKKEIALFNKVKKEECIKEDIFFVDITPLTLKVKTSQDLLAKDNLHYSGKMHQLWVEEILKKIKRTNERLPQ